VIFIKHSFVQEYFQFGNGGITEKSILFVLDSFLILEWFLDSSSKNGNHWM